MPMSAKEPMILERAWSASALLLAVILSGGLAGCGSAGFTSASSTESAPSSKTSTAASLGSSGDAQGQMPAYSKAPPQKASQASSAVITPDAQVGGDGSGSSNAKADGTTAATPLDPGAETANGDPAAKGNGNTADPGNAGATVPSGSDAVAPSAPSTAGGSSGGGGGFGSCDVGTDMTVWGTPDSGCNNIQLSMSTTNLTAAIGVPVQLTITVTNNNPPTCGPVPNLHMSFNVPISDNESGIAQMQNDKFSFGLPGFTDLASGASQQGQMTITATPGAGFAPGTYQEHFNLGKYDQGDGTASAAYFTSDVCFTFTAQ